MDPCPFVRVVVRNLGLQLPNLKKPNNNYSNSPNSSFFCKIKLKDHPTQISTIPSLSQENHQIEDHINGCFNNLSRVGSGPKPRFLKIELFEKKEGVNCGFKNKGKLVWVVLVDLKGLGDSGSRAFVVQNGWVDLEKWGKLNVCVRVEPDPRFVFQFDGEPECSPQVFQVNGNVRQAVFTCKFGFRNAVGDTNLRSRSSVSESGNSKNWLPSLRRDTVQHSKERKGWSITIHDLQGSPVAAASMVTPFVPSMGTNRVSKSNPGAWLILQPGQGTWKPWGRLEAWLEHGDRLGYRFEHFPDGGVDTITLSNATLSTKNGGKFSIDNSTGPSPMSTPSSSFDSGSVSSSDIGSGSWAHLFYRGFVMSSTVMGSGKCSKPEVEVSIHHVTCKEDAAAFVALAAAMDLTMDACKLFSRKLRKELRQPSQD